MSHSRSGHWLLRQLVRPGASSFRKSSLDLEQVQRSKLSETLKRVAGTPMGRANGIEADWSWETFAEKMPVTDYSDWTAAVESQMKTGANGLIRSKVMRYQPTSGSSSAIKWIPYTKQFLSELDGAISPWLSDLYENYPGVRQGCHYWSLSWLPTEMREKASGDLNDDMQLLSLGKRWLAAKTQAIGDGVALAPTSDDSLFATLAMLTARPDLTAISVWSPTFALGMFERLADWREELAQVLEKGHWGNRHEGLRHLRAPKNPRAAAILRNWSGEASSYFYRDLWPSLALVSAWDTAAARPWAKKLRASLPQASFQGKGLWATEGVVTIPMQRSMDGDGLTDHVLAVNSHAYEFEDVATGEILPPWKLEQGQQVSPLMTTGSGMLRYRLGDQLEVTGFHNQLPAMRFLGRGGTTDMVGEKISTVIAQQVLDSLPWPAGVSPVVMLAAPEAGERPVYTLLAEAPPEMPVDKCRAISRQLEEALEAALHEHFHYQLARNLGQLAPARCLCAPGISEGYMLTCRDRGMIEGDIKVEALRAWPGELPARCLKLAADGALAKPSVKAEDPVWG